MDTTNVKTQKAILRYLHIAPRKVRLIAGTLRGLSVQEAEAQLMMRVQRSAKPLLKLLRSAIANAKNNQKMDPKTLVISEIRVDQGPVLKRFLPRAQGRATPLLKKMSHITITLAESTSRKERFVFVPKAKKSATKKSTEVKKPKMSGEESQANKAREKGGFFKKMFQRKSA